MALYYSGFLDYNDLAKVYAEIYMVRSKWDSLGLQLGILGTDIDAVRRECRGNVAECLQKILSMWLKRANPKAVWKALITALKSNTVGFEQLAEELEYKHCQLQNRESRTAGAAHKVVSSLAPQSQSPVGLPDGIHSLITASSACTVSSQVHHQDLLKVMQASQGTSSMVKAMVRDEQIKKLASLFKQRNKTIGVFYSYSQSQKATKILHRLSDLLYGGDSIAQKFEILPEMADWLQKALFSGVNYFIFVGLPPQTTITSSATPPRSKLITEATYFDTQKYAQRVAEVVVVNQNESQHIHTHNNPHYLDNFVWLNSEDMDKIAEDSLALFAAPTPKPCYEAYFSDVPELIIVKTKIDLSLITQEMSPDSEFPRIVLVNECVEFKDVKMPLHKNTHIQSYNGAFLDGMDIKEVISIFKSLRSKTAYLMVRYVHPIKQLQRMVTPIYKPEAPRLDPLTEELPIPLYILGDYLLCEKLFDLLKEESTATDPKRFLQADIISVDSGTSSLSNSGNHDDHPSHDYCISTELDEAIFQVVASTKLFNSTKHTMVETTKHKCISPPTGRRLYILQLPQENIDRYFTHIFFRNSGIYLIMVSFEEMMRDPSVKPFENTCYWLRQIQTYVIPANIKRVIIVGVHNTDTDRSDKLPFFLTKLDQAIQETNPKQIMENSREHLTLLFNLGDLDKSIHLLCQHVNKCVDVMIKKSWCYERDFYYCTFQPFTQLTSIMSKISRIRAVVASTRVIEDCYNFTDTRYMTMLANYSHACISSKGNYHLLCPAFLIDLLLSMEMTFDNYLIHATNINAVKRLPIFGTPFPKQQMEILITSKVKLLQLTSEEQEAILDWAEELELIFSLGKLEEYVLYFVPFLATEAFNDHQASIDWDHQEAMRFQADDITILYAEMHIPSTYQFFYRLIAELLKDVITVPCMQKSGRCRIKLGCTEAILPLQFVDMDQTFSWVYLRYHPLQNMIEFRAKIVKQQLAFLKALESKIKGALSSSKSYSGNCDNFHTAFSFTLPAVTSHNSTQTESALWALYRAVREERKLDKGESDDAREATVLIKTRPMNPDAQREWASSISEKK